MTYKEKADNKRWWLTSIEGNESAKYMFARKVRECEEKVRSTEIALDKIYRYKQQQKFELSDRHDIYILIMIGLCKERIKQLNKELEKFSFLHRKASGKLSKKLKEQELAVDDAKMVSVCSILGIQEKSRGRTQIKCPVHNEKTPSCTIYHEQNRWHCFGCSEGGDVIDLVMKMHGHTFKEAITYLLNLTI